MRIQELVQIIFTINQNLFMLTQVFACAVFGIDAVPITIEVHIDAGIGYHLVCGINITFKQSDDTNKRDTYK